MRFARYGIDGRPKAFALLCSSHPLEVATSLYSGYHDNRKPYCFILPGILFLPIPFTPISFRHFLSGHQEYVLRLTEDGLSTEGGLRRIGSSPLQW
jgi:hypothetical protein